MYVLYWSLCLLILGGMAQGVTFTSGIPGGVSVTRSANPAFQCTLTYDNTNSSLDLPPCAASGATLDDARALAYTFAPIVHFHPLEVYHLEDPTVYFKQSQFLGVPATWEYLGGKNGTATEMLQQAIKSPPLMGVLEKAYMTVLGDVVLGGEAFSAAAGSVLAGAPFVGNLSTAKVYYNVFEEGGSWVYNFYLFYPFNGCSNEELSVAFDGVYSGVNFVICPPGVHESDWERLTVVVCPATKNITRLQFAEHGWSSNYDCTKGECPPKENGHPAVYAGLDSHASYPIPSPNMVYQKVDLSFLPSLDGVFIVDRTMADTGKRFVPTKDNIVELLNPMNITADSEQIWGAFPGSWGGHQVNPGFDVHCISDDQKSFVTCPNNKAYSLMTETLGLNNASSARKAVQRVQDVIVNAINQSFSGGDIMGPWQKESSFYWGNDQTKAIAPLWTTFKDSIPTCAMTGNPSDTARIPVQFKSTNLSGYLWFIAMGTIGFAIVAAIVMLVINIFFDYTISLTWVNTGVKVPTAVKSRIFFRQGTSSVKFPEGELSQQAESTADKDAPAAESASESSAEGESGGRIFAVVRERLWVRFVLVGIALVFFILGAVLLLVGITNLFDLMQNIKSNSLWNVLKKLFVIGVTLIGFLDLLICITHIAAQPMFWVRKGRPFPKWISRLHILMGCMISIVIMTAMLTFGLGVVVSIARILFAGVCERVANFAIGTGVCLDLGKDGLDDKSLCGNDLADFCNNWNDLRVDNITIGAAFLLWSHVLFLVLTTKDFFLSHPFRWITTPSSKA